MKRLLVVTGILGWAGGMATMVMSGSCDVECAPDGRPAVVLSLRPMHGDVGRVLAAGTHVTFSVESIDAPSDPYDSLREPVTDQIGRCLDEECLTWALGADRPGRYRVAATLCGQTYETEIEVGLDEDECHVVTEYEAIMFDASRCDLPGEPVRKPMAEPEPTRHVPGEPVREPRAEPESGRTAPGEPMRRPSAEPDWSRHAPGHAVRSPRGELEPPQMGGICDTLPHPSAHVWVAVQEDDYFRGVDVDHVWFQLDDQVGEGTCVDPSGGGCSAWTVGRDHVGTLTISTEYCDQEFSTEVEVGRTADRCHAATEFVTLRVDTSGCLKDPSHVPNPPDPPEPVEER